MQKGKVTLQMLSEMMAANSGRSKSAAEGFVRAFFTVLKDALQRDNIVKIKGFGTFKLVVVAARESVNVNTGERMNIAEYNKITFTPDKPLKNRVNRSFAQFDTIVLEDEDLSLIDASAVTADAGDASEDAEAPETTPVPSLRRGEETLSQPAPKVEEMPPAGGLRGAPIADTPPTPAVVEDVKAAPLMEERAHANDATEEEAEEKVASVEEADTPPVPEERPVPTPEPASETEAKEAQRRKRTLRIIGAVLFAVGVIIGFLFAVNSGKDKADGNASTNAQVDSVVVGTAQKAEQGQDSIALLREAAKEYEQVEGGKYLIAGLKCSRKISPQRNFVRYCKHLYGTDDVVPYVMKFNNLKSEYVPVGKLIKFPILILNQ